MVGLLALVWLAFFVWGMIGLFKPWFVGFPSRWVAFSVLTLSFVFVIAAGEYSSAEQENAPGATIAFLMVWAVFAATVIFIRTGVRAHNLAKLGDPKPGNRGFVERWAARWASYAISQKRRYGGNSSAEEQTGIVTYAVPTPVQSREIKQTREPASILAVQEALKDRRVTPPIPSKRRPYTPRNEEVSLRPTRDHSSGWAGYIVYTDAKGEMSERRIVVKRIEGYGRAETVFAWCCERSAYRRFLIGKISELVDVETGEVLDPQAHFNQLANEGAIGTTDKSLADLVTILVFLARCDGEAHPVEMDVIEDAVLTHIQRFGGEPKLAQKTARSARKLAPDADDFLAALMRVQKHPNRSALANIILNAASDVMAADGRMAAEEIHWFLPISEALEEMVR